MLEAPLAIRPGAVRASGHLLSCLQVAYAVKKKTELTKALCRHHAELTRRSHLLWSLQVAYATPQELEAFEEVLSLTSQLVQKYKY
jgi:hypothetical protein